MKTSKKHILLVEDEPFTAAAQIKMLEEYGYTVTKAADGKKAVRAALEDRELDIILMDINLGRGMDGTEAAEQILKKRDIPIIFLTSHTSPEIVEKTETISSYGYVVKDSNIAVLVASIKMAFRLHEANRELQRKGEELASANEELQQAVEELEEANDELHESRNSLIEQEKELRLFEQIGLSTGEALAVIDTGYTYLLVNPVYELYWNQNKDHIIGKRVPDILGEGVFNSTVREKIDRCLSGETVQYSRWFDFPKLGRRYLNVHYYPHHDDAGSVISLIMVARDMTDYREAEDQIRNAMGFLKSVIDQAPFAIQVSEGGPDNFTITMANGESRRLTGADDTAGIGIKDGELLRPEKLDWEMFRPDGTPWPVEELPLPMAQRGETVTGQVMIIRRRDGTETTVMCNAGPILGHDGSIIGALVTFYDITDLKEAQRAIRESEERFQLAVEGARDGLWDWNLLTNEAYHSDRFARMLGYEPDDLPYTSDAWSDLLHPEDRDRAFKTVQDYLEGRSDIYESTFRMKAKTGAWRWITGRGRAVWDESGRPVRFVGFNTDITERKRLEEELLKANEIINRSPSVVFLWKNEKRWPVDFVTENAAALFGYTAEQFKNGSVSYEEIVHPDDLDRVIAEVNAAVESGAVSFTHEPYRITGKDGAVRWVRDTTNIRRDASGEATHFEGTVHDITDQRQVELALAESQERIRRLADATFEAVIIHDKGAVLDVNPACSELFGYTREELIGMNVLDFAVPEHRDVARKNVAEGSEIPYEATGLRKDGSTFYGEIRGSDLTIDGKVTRVAVVRDITARKLHEEELKKVHDEVKRHLAFIEDLMATVPTPIFYKDVEGQYIGCNRAFTEFTGLTVDDMRGKTVEEVWPGDNAAVYHQMDMELLRKPETQTYEYTVVDKIGTRRDVIFNKDVFRDEKGEVAGLVGAFLDITERKRIEMELQQALNEKEELLRELQHRVKNSLAMIKGMVYLESERSGEPKVKEALGEIEHRVMSLSNLYNMLYRSGSVREVALDEYCRNIIHNLSGSYADMRGIVELDVKLDNIVMDVKSAAPVGLILTELLTNAYKHGFTEERGGTIVISLQNSGSLGELTVANTGRPLPQDFALEQYSGMGLELVRALTDQLEGDLYFESGNETQFRITFPL